MPPNNVEKNGFNPFMPMILVPVPVPVPVVVPIFVRLPLQSPSTDEAKNLPPGWLKPLASNENQLYTDDTEHYITADEDEDDDLTPVKQRSVKQRLHGQGRITERRDSTTEDGTPTEVKQRIPSSLFLPAEIPENDLDSLNLREDNGAQGSGIAGGSIDLTVEKKCPKFHISKRSRGFNCQSKLSKGDSGVLTSKSYLNEEVSPGNAEELGEARQLADGAEAPGVVNSVTRAVFSTREETDGLKKAEALTSSSTGAIEDNFDQDNIQSDNKCDNKPPCSQTAVQLEPNSKLGNTRKEQGAGKKNNDMTSTSESETGFSKEGTGIKRKQDTLWGIISHIPYIQELTQEESRPLETSRQNYDKTMRAGHNAGYRLACNSHTGGKNSNIEKDIEAIISNDLGRSSTGRRHMDAVSEYSSHVEPRQGAEEYGCHVYDEDHGSDEILIKEVDVSRSNSWAEEDTVLHRPFSENSDTTLLKEVYHQNSNIDQGETRLKSVENSRLSEFSQEDPSFNFDDTYKFKGVGTASSESEFSDGGHRFQQQTQNSQRGSLSDLNMDCEGDEFIPSGSVYNNSQSITPAEWNNIAERNEIPPAQLLNTRKSKAIGTSSEGESSDISMRRGITDNNRRRRQQNRGFRATGRANNMNRSSGLLAGEPGVGSAVNNSFYRNRVENRQTSDYTRHNIGIATGDWESLRELEEMLTIVNEEEADCVREERQNGRVNGRESNRNMNNQGEQLPGRSRQGLDQHRWSPVEEQLPGEDRRSPGADRQLLGEDRRSHGAGRQPPGEDRRSPGEGRHPLGEDRQSPGADRQLHDQDSQSPGEGRDSLGENRQSPGEGRHLLGQDRRSPGSTVSPEQSDNSLLNFETDNERARMPRNDEESPPLCNSNELLFVYHTEAEVWTQLHLVNRLKEMRSSIKISLLHQLFCKGMTKTKVAVESLKKCNHVVVVLSRRFQEHELNSYILEYVVESFRDKLVIIKSETCDAPSIIGALKILTLDSPNFWRNLVAGIDEDQDQVTEDWKKPWLYRGQDPFLLVKSRPSNPVQPHLQQRISVPSTPDRRNDHRVVFLVNLAGREGLRPYDHSHECTECPTYRVKTGKIQVNRFLRDSQIPTRERQVEKCVKCWEDKYRQPDSEEALKNEMAFWIRLQNPASAHKIKAFVQFELQMTEPGSHEPRTVHTSTIEFETKPLRPKQPKKQVIKRKPGNQGDEEFGDDDIRYVPRPSGRGNPTTSRNGDSGAGGGGGATGGAGANDGGSGGQQEHSNGASGSSEEEVEEEVEEVASDNDPTCLTGVQESGEDKSLTYDCNGIDLEQGAHGIEKKNNTGSGSTRIAASHSGFMGSASGIPQDGTQGLETSDTNDYEIKWPNTLPDRDNLWVDETERGNDASGGAQQQGENPEVEGYIYTSGVTGMNNPFSRVKRPKNVMEELFSGMFSGGVKPKPSNPHYDSGGHHGKRKNKKTRKYHGSTHHKDTRDPLLLATGVVEDEPVTSSRPPPFLSCPAPLTPRPGPPETVRLEDIEEVEEQEREERRRAGDYDRLYHTPKEWMDIPRSNKRMDLGIGSTTRGGLFTSKRYHDLVVTLEQLGEKSKDPQMYKQFMEEADLYMKKYSKKIRTDEKIIITLKKCGVEHYLNNMKDASEHVRTALSLLPQAKYQSQLEARTYYYISTIYREKKKFGKAKHWIKKAKDCLQHVEKGEDSAKTYYNEGRLYMRMLSQTSRNENYREQAIECFKISMDHAKYEFEQYSTRLDSKLIRRCLLNMARIQVDFPETDIGMARDIVTHENLLEAEDCITQIKKPQYYHNMSQRNHVQLLLAEAGLAFRRARMFCKMDKMSKAEMLIGDAVIKTKNALMIAQIEKFKEAKIAQDFIKNLTLDHIFLVSNVKTDYNIIRNKMESTTSSSDIATDGPGRQRRVFYGPSSGLSDSGTASSCPSDTF